MHGRGKYVWDDGVEYEVSLFNLFHRIFNCFRCTHFNIYTLLFYCTTAISSFDNQNCFLFRYADYYFYNFLSKWLYFLCLIIHIKIFLWFTIYYCIAHVWIFHCFHCFWNLQVLFPWLMKTNWFIFLISFRETFSKMRSVERELTDGQTEG